MKTLTVTCKDKDFVFESEKQILLDKAEKDISIVSKKGTVYVKSDSGCKISLEVSGGGKITAEGQGVAMEGYKVKPSVPVAACSHQAMHILQPPPPSPPVPSFLATYGFAIDGEIKDQNAMGQNTCSKNVSGKEKIAMAGAAVQLKNHPKGDPTGTSFSSGSPAEIQRLTVFMPMGQLRWTNWVVASANINYGWGTVTKIGGAQTVYSCGELVARENSYVDTCCELGMKNQGVVKKS